MASPRTQRPSNCPCPNPDEPSKSSHPRAPHSSVTPPEGNIFNPDKNIYKIDLSDSHSDSPSSECSHNSEQSQQGAARKVVLDKYSSDSEEGVGDDGYEGE